MSRVGEESSVDWHDPETGEVTESASLEMERSEKMRTSEDIDGSVLLISNEDSGLESDGHDNSGDLRTAEVSVSVGDWHGGAACRDFAHRSTPKRNQA